MSVIRKHGKKFQVLIRRKDSPHIIKSFVSKEAAREWARETEVNIERGFYANSSYAQRMTLGQKLILQYLQKQEALTGKKPFVILDNLRSLSGYLENDSDGWRPIGLFLRDLRGHGYSSLVLDHTGKDQNAGMRGTSSKGDWANVIMQIVPEDSKGSKLMKMKIKFDKARGLRPDEAADYICQYDFTGNWTLGQSTKDQEDAVYKKHIVELLKQRPKPSQKAMGKTLNIAVGKVNKLMQEMEKEE
jgi:hypothetical protein